MKYIPTINIHAAVEIVASASCSLSLLYLLTTGSGRSSYFHYQRTSSNERL